jgi:alpha-ribazole phosphatase
MTGHDLNALRARAMGPALTLLRHPRVVAEGLVYGRTDPPLGPSAAQEIAAACARARALRLTPDVVRCSPSPRALALAEALAAALGVAHAPDPRLLELDFGAWEGLRWDALDRAESDPWAEDPWHLAPPGGESFGDLTARVADVLAEAPEGAVLVTHAGVVRAARMLREGIDFAAAFAAPVPYAAPRPLRARFG